MDKTVQKNNSFVTLIRENHEGAVVINQVEECSKRYIQIQSCNEGLCSTKTFKGRETGDVTYELIAPDDGELEFSDDQSSIEEIENTNLENYKVNFTVREIWNCPYCPYRAKKIDFIHRHIMDTHGSVTCYKCQECQYVHAQLSLVMAHYNRSHNKIKYECPDCKFKFTTLWNCQGHILIRHPDKAKKLLQTVIKKRENNRRCPFCQFKDSSSTILKKHVERNHFDVIRFKCLYCNYNNIDVDDISEHIKDLHHEEMEDVDVLDFV